MVEQYGPLIVEYGTQLLIAIVVLIVGIKLVNRLVKFLDSKFTAAHMDASLQSFIIPFLSTVLKILVVVLAAGLLGAEMTSMAAIIGSAGLAIGLAFQGSLSNFAGGVLILILKPFKVGDFIEVNGEKGTVREIQIFYTIMSTPDNKKIIIPNSKLSNSSAINYSAYETRRIAFQFGLPYGTNLEKAKNTFRQVVEKHPLVLEDPAPFVRLGEHGPNGLIFNVRVWVNNSDYWAVHWDILEAVTEMFEEEGLEIPFAQLDVNLRQEASQQ